MKTINAIAEIDADGWLNVHARMPEKMEVGPVEAVIVLQPRASGLHDAAKTGCPPIKQKAMMACIQELRQLGPIPGLEDPIAWQRASREDRDLFHGK